MRDGLSNNEVEEPLSRGRERHIHSSQSCSGNLGDDNPAAWTPAELEESGEKKDAGEGEVANGRDGVAFDWGIEAHVEADDEHGASLGDGGPE